MTKREHPINAENNNDVIQAPVKPYPTRVVTGASWKREVHLCVVL